MTCGFSWTISLSSLGQLSGFFLYKGLIIFAVVMITFKKAFTGLSKIQLSLRDKNIQFGFSETKLKKKLYLIKLDIYTSAIASNFMQLCRCPN